MKVTVGICTWNRADLLDRTLAELCRLDIPSGITWEVVLVDNNCTDHTPEVAERYTGRLPLRRVLETQQGHSVARNRAVQEARGELFLWTDDDVLMSTNWLAEYVRVADEYPQAGYFGGRITPWFADDIPGEVRQMVEAHLPLLGPVYSLKDYGTAVRLFTPDEMPFGANMGFRTALLHKYPFDPKFGRVKHGLIGADEVAVIGAMIADGVPGVWIGSTEVKHYIPRGRTTRKHFWRYFHGIGRTHVRLNGLPAGPTLFGKPRWAIMSSWKHRARAWVQLARNKPDWLADYLTAAKLSGYAAESGSR